MKFTKSLLRLNITLLFIFCLGLSIASSQSQKEKFSKAGFFSVENSPRQVYNFNQGWRFYKGDVDGAERIDFNDSKWEAANLPHGLEILPENASGGRNYQGVAWYRKRFTVKANEGKTYIYFEAVMGKCVVYVNGIKVCEHFGGYLPFVADVTDIIKKNENNFIAVKADNSDDKLYPPGKIQGGLDFSYLGGIYRDVYLVQTSNVHVSFPELSSTVAGGGVFAATLDVNDNDIKMFVRTEVNNASSVMSSVVVKTTLEDAEYNKVQSFTQKTKLGAGQSKQLEKKFEAKNVHLWHPDDPYLHFIKTTVMVNGKVVDEMRTRIGIRLYEMRGHDGMYINKKPYEEKIIGVNRHQDYAYVGNALPNSGQWRDVKKLREGGSRIIRVAHYPCDPAFYDACDELGMFTTTANPGWHFWNTKAPIFEQRIYEDTRNLVRAARNYASILFWETALNETPSVPERVNANMHKYAHEELPFPGVFTATDYHEAKKAGFDFYYNFNDSKTNSFQREYGDGGEVDNWFSQNAETRVKMEWGEKPLLNQALIQAEVLSQYHDSPKIQLGGAKWAGIDHQRGYHPDTFWGGLLNIYRLPKYLYYMYMSQYDYNYKVPGIKTGPMMFVANELTQVSPSDVVVFSNCDEIRLTWLGEEVGIQKPSQEEKYSHLPHPPFIFKDVFDFSVIKSTWRNNIPNVNMRIEGIINGEVVLEEHRDYAQQSAAIKLSIDDDGMALTADGSDFIPIRATVVDIDGNKKVLASEQVYFEVDGPAEIIGGKANFANPAKTEFGIATLLIRASNQAGTITVTAHSNGLKSDSFTFESIPAQMKMVYDMDYADKSLKPSQDKSVIVQKEKSNMPMDVLELHKEIKQIQLELVGKEQEIMELRSRLKSDK